MEIEKSARLLYLYQDLVKGAGIQKKAAADRFGVNERSLQRDMRTCAAFLQTRSRRARSSMTHGKKSTV